MGMEQKTLSISQMLQLRNLGVDTTSASIVLIFKDDYGEVVDWDKIKRKLSGGYYSVNSNGTYMDVHPFYYDAETGDYDHSLRECCGVFTLDDILSFFIYIEDGTDTEYSYTLSENHGASCIIFERYDFLGDSGFFPVHTIPFRENRLEAAYKMLCWTVVNGYLNKE